MNKWDQLKQVIAACQVEADKFYVVGNKQAGKRLRKKMQEIRVLAGEIRKEVQELNKK